MTGYTITMGGWSATTGQRTIHESGSSLRQVYNASVQLNDNGISKLTFTMLPDHPLMQEMVLLGYSDAFHHQQDESSINLFFNDTLLFHGVITSKSENINKEVTFECKDDLTLFENAYIILRYPWVADDATVLHYPPKAAIEYILGKYNELVSNKLKVYIDDSSDFSGVGYDDGNEVGVDLPLKTPITVLDLLNKVFVEQYNCRIKISLYASRRQLCVYSGSTGNSGQTVTFGNNMVDYNSDVITDELYTGVVPMGATYNKYFGEPYTTVLKATATKNSTVLRIRWGDARYIALEQSSIFDGEDEYAVNSVQDKDKSDTDYDTVVDVYLEDPLKRTINSGTTLKWDHTSGLKTTERRTIEAQPDGTYGNGKYQKKGMVLYDIEAVERYGPRFFILDMNTENYSANLLAKAQEAMANHPQASVTVEVSAIDMALYMDGYEHLKAGQTLHVVSEPHGIDADMVVSDIEIDLDNPASTKYVLGLTPSTISGKLAKNRLDLALLNNINSYRFTTL